MAALDLAMDHQLRFWDSPILAIAARCSARACNKALLGAG
jgi:predicted nucleic acid-binding protein